MYILLVVQSGPASAVADYYTHEKLGIFETVSSEIFKADVAGWSYQQVGRPLPIYPEAYILPIYPDETVHL